MASLKRVLTTAKRHGRHVQRTNPGEVPSAPMIGDVGENQRRKPRKRRFSELQRRVAGRLVIIQRRGAISQKKA